MLLQANPKSPPAPYLISNAEKDTISLMVPAKGEEGRRFAAVRKGTKLSVKGPLGRHIVRAEYGNIAIVCDAKTAGAACWIGQSLRGGENKVYLIVGIKGKPTKQLNAMLDESADKVFVVSDAQSKIGYPSVNELHNLMRKKHISLTFTLVDLPLSYQLARITHLRSKTFSFLTPILDDGVGICADCRVMYDGETKLACIEGPALDAHKIEWESLLGRHGHEFDGERATLDLSTKKGN